MPNPKQSPSQYMMKRKNIRFKPEGSTLAWIDLNPASAQFTPQVKALTFSESAGGCGLVVLINDFFTADSKLKVQIGELKPLVAEICWIQELDADVCKVGLRYVD
jgi:hypothetical protein